MRRLQCGELVGGAAPQLPSHRLLVDVGRIHARVAGTELVCQSVEVGQFGQRGGGVGQPQPLFSAQLLAPGPRQVRAQCTQVIGEFPERLLHLVVEGLRHQLGQFGALFVGE